MFTTSSIAAYIESPDACNIELTEAIWTELGWTTKGHCVVKIESELVEGTDYKVFTNIGKNSGGRPIKTFSLSYNGLKILAASTTTPKGKAYRRHLVETENKYIQLMKATPVKSLSRVETIALGYEALGKVLAQERYCADKPGLRNIVEFISQPNALNAAKASVQEIASTVYGIDLEPGEVMSLGRTCATTYRTWHNTEPEKELQEINGRKTHVCVYGTEMYSTIENWLTNKGYSV